MWGWRESCAWLLYDLLRWLVGFKNTPPSPIKANLARIRAVRRVNWWGFPLSPCNEKVQASAIQLYSMYIPVQPLHLSHRREGTLHPPEIWIRITVWIRICKNNLRSGGGSSSRSVNHSYRFGLKCHKNSSQQLWTDKLNLYPNHTVIIRQGNCYFSSYFIK